MLLCTSYDKLHFIYFPPLCWTFMYFNTVIIRLILTVHRKISGFWTTVLCDIVLWTCVTTHRMNALFQSVNNSLCLTWRSNKALWQRVECWINGHQHQAKTVRGWSSSGKSTNRSDQFKITSRLLSTRSTLYFPASGEAPSVVYW